MSIESKSSTWLVQDPAGTAMQPLHTEPQSSPSQAALAPGTTEAARAGQATGAACRTEAAPSHTSTAASRLCRVDHAKGLQAGGAT